MLQMRPWKMSLLLEGNNNSKFQLLLTLQSSVFPSERIRRQGESEFAPCIPFFNKRSAEHYLFRMCNLNFMSVIRDNLGLLYQVGLS